MKKITCILLFLFQFTVKSQHFNIVWEKRIPILRDDNLYAIQKTDSGYMAAGNSFSRSYSFRNYSNNTVPEYVLVKLDKEGKNPKIIHTGTWAMYGNEGISLKKCKDKNFYMARSIQDTGNYLYSSVWLHKIDQNGNEIWGQEFPNTYEWAILDLFTSPDGGALISGNKGSANPPNYSEGFVIKVDSNGIEEWRKTFSPSIIVNINHIELLNGTQDNFLVSGNAGQYIWAAWLDNNGITIKERKIYYDTANYQLGSAEVLQSPNGNLICWSVNSASNYQSYLGVYNISGDTNIYEQLFYGAITGTFVNSTSDIMILAGYGSTIYFKKYDKNFGLVDTLLFSSDLRRRHFKYFNTAVWCGSDTAVFGGGINNDTTGRDFYFVKIAGVGNQYLTDTKPLIGEKSVSLYPNPAKEWFKINSEANGEVRLYTSSGQEVLAQTVQSGEAVSLSGLPQGLYLWRFVANGQVRSGKVVRE